MHIRCAYLAAALAAALCLTACGHGGGGPTAPAETDTFKLSATLSDSDGVPHIVEAVAILDQRTIGDSCPANDEEPVFDSDGNLIQYNCDAPPVSSYTFNASGPIGSGAHTLQFGLTTQQDLGTYSYTVAAFDVLIYDDTGKLIHTISFASTTTSLPIGKAITYNFSF